MLVFISLCFGQNCFDKYKSVSDVSGGDYGRYSNEYIDGKQAKNGTVYCIGDIAKKYGFETRYEFSKEKTFNEYMDYIYVSVTDLLDKRAAKNGLMSFDEFVAKKLDEPDISTERMSRIRTSGRYFDDYERYIENAKK